MPRGPRVEKRPADVIGNVVKVMRIATGEETEELETDRAKRAAAELGSRGGKARAARMTPERRQAIAKKAAKARSAAMVDGGRSSPNRAARGSSIGRPDGRRELAILVREIRFDISRQPT
jgi:hypothetical protein